MMKRWTVACLVALVPVLAACGSSGGGGAAPAKTADTAWMKDYKPPASGCGSFTAPMPSDRDGVLATLDPQHRDAYAGVTNFDGNLTQILKSTWADWRPSHPAPYKVAVSWSGLFNDYQVQIYARLQDAFKAAGYNATFKTTGNVLDVPQQLQQFDQLLLDKPDLMILQASTPDSFKNGLQRAAAAGIPVITANSTIASADAVNVDANYYLAAANDAAQVVRALNGKGNVVLLHGLAGSANDSQSDPAWKQVLKGCPGIKLAGEVYGGYANNLAKQEMLKFLGTHPQEIDAVIETGAMAVGALQAFQQSGRPVPIIAEGGPTKGLLGYWNEHEDTYYIANSVAPATVAGAVSDVTALMLDGAGVELNLVLAVPPVVNNANLASWNDAAWTSKTPGTAPGPRSWYMTRDYLEGFFANPGK